MTSIVTVQDNTTGRSEPVKGTNNAIHIIRADVGIGEDQTRNMLITGGQWGYERVEASQTAQVLGGTGAAGDILHGFWLEANTGTVIILDNATTVLTVPASQAKGWYDMGDIVSVSGAWKVTTAASTSVVMVGDFTA